MDKNKVVCFAASLRKAVATVCLLTAAAFGHAQSLDDLTFITEEFPPFNFERDGKRQGIAVDAHGLTRGLRCRHRQMVHCFQGAARHRHFGADDIDRLCAAHSFGGGLRHLGQFGGARGDRRIGRRGAFAGATHAGVEMDLLISAEHAGAH